MNNSQSKSELQKKYWSRNISLITYLLVVWALVSYVGGIIFAEPLSKISFFGVTLSFWLAHQGAILVFIGLIVVYAVRMDALDREFNFQKAKTSKERLVQQKEVSYEH